MDGLTGNDIARCLASVQIHQRWWKHNDNGSDFAKAERAKLDALNKKLSAILNQAVPTDAEGALDDSTADSVLLRPVS